MPLPNFVIIGAQKSASRWLRNNLGHHPDVFTSGSVLQFFSSEERFRKGLDWYSAEFAAGWRGEPLIGEASPPYMLWTGPQANAPELAAERIGDTLPGVKLIAILRNPVDRAYSAFIHHMARGRIPSSANLNQFVRRAPPEDEPQQVITGSWYARGLAPYVERFGDSLIVLLLEDAKRDASGFYRAALEHIGARPDFEPERLREVLFRGIPPPDSEYRSDNGGKRELTPVERADLFSYFEDDVLRLERLLGRDLGRWRPG